jgi:LmbE family N-acetylglucosaminyl deacetylase
VSTPALPGITEHVSATCALVVVPHPDDEVLGCGGLLAQLASQGTRLQLVFLTDGAGAPAAPDSGPGAANVRRQECVAALTALGLGAAARHFLDLPDGRLDEHVARASAALSALLLDLRPDLVLLPSPLEITGDHRAAAQATHEALGAAWRAARPTALEPALLLYEVNHPQHPDLLVDVSANVEGLGAAMAAYASQQQRHDYLAAGLGLRRYRTLSLPPTVSHAEGYRRLTTLDLITRSPAQLVAWLGGQPEITLRAQGPRLSLIVRTRDRPALLAEALASVAANDYRNAEVVLVNDGGVPVHPPADFPFEVRALVGASARGRAWAAQAGVEAAQGDVVCFLDDDDLLAPEHLATLAGLLATPGVRAAYTDAAVGEYVANGDGGWTCRQRALPYSRDFDAARLLLDNYIPFHTLAVERTLLIETGPFDTQLAMFEDWDLLIRLAARAPFQHLAQVTCEYRHFVGAAHAHALGGRRSESAEFVAAKARVLAKHAERLTSELLARASIALVDEAVQARAGAAEAQARADQQTRGRQAQLDDLSRELARVYAQERRLTDDLTRLLGAHEVQQRALASAQAESVRWAQLVGQYEGASWGRRLRLWLDRLRGRGPA